MVPKTKTPLLTSVAVLMFEPIFQIFQNATQKALPVWSQAHMRIKIKLSLNGWILGMEVSGFKGMPGQTTEN